MEIEDISSVKSAESNELNASNEAMDDDSEAGQSSQTLKKRKPLDSRLKFKKMKMKHGQPTPEEMLMIRESETLYKSNLFRLEIEELLKEVRPLKSSRRAIKIWVEQFKHSLKYFKKIPARPLNNLDWVNNELGIKVPEPFQDWAKSHDQEFEFLLPSDIKIVGSFNTHGAQTDSISADVLLIVPSEVYVQNGSSNETCLLDHAYFIKRFLYLCVIANHLKKSSLLKRGSTVQFSCEGGVILKPTVLIRPATDIEQSIGIHFSAVPDTRIFQESQMGNQVSNIQRSEGLPSPLYNSTIAADMFLLDNEETRLALFRDNSPYRDAMRLLKIWLNQRGLNRTFGGFSSYIMSMYVMHLADIQKINKMMSSYQVLRIVWSNLAKADWCKNGISMCKRPSEEVPTLSSFHQNFPVVFVDPSGFCNLAARMQRQVFEQVKFECGLALKHLNSSCIKGFQSLFITKMDFLRQFDHFISINNYSTIKVGAGDLVPDDSDWAVPKFISNLSDHLIRFLGKRAKFISYTYVIPSWKVTESCQLNSLNDSLVFGIALDPQLDALSVIDKGPSADLPEAAEFREMWCGKSEIRRFRDGTVCEAMVWGDAKASLSERMMLNKKIVDFIFTNKFHIGQNEYIYIANQLDYALSLNERNKFTSVEEVTMQVNQSLNDLTQKLMALPDLSLSITSVSGISPVNRGTDLFPPLSLTQYGTFLWSPTIKYGADRMCQFSPSIHVLIQLESSGKWPKDLPACKRLISSFYISLAKSLRTHLKIESIIKTDCLIIRKDGYMFKLEIGNSKLLSLIKLKRENGVEQYESTTETEEYEKRYFILPKLTSALQGLNTTFPGFGGATRLAKRWLGSQLIDSSFLPTIATELLVASIFVHPEPYSTPVQPLPAFLRFLDMLAYTNWNYEPVVVNFNQMLTKDEMKEIESYFTENRAELPPLFLATPYDKFGCMFTKNPYGPDLLTLIRLSYLAQRSIKKLRFNLTGNLPLGIFDHDLTKYDVIIKLDKDQVSRYYQRILLSDSDVGSERPKKKSPTYAKPPTDFDSAGIYLKKLREVYTEFALFFYDEFGGTEVAVKFKPTAYSPSQFKYQEAGGRMAAANQQTPSLKFNMTTALSDFKELGARLVLDVVPTETFRSTLESA